ncbi:hypothetical protein GQR58_019698 [Nymphon striatum]|nr:hypothetical protein GQR58_019698 [Nymphon striatum]
MVQLLCHCLNVHINSPGPISRKIPCLCRSETLGEWIVHRCLNCHNCTHAVHASKGLDRVLVSEKLIMSRSEVHINLKIWRSRRENDKQSVEKLKDSLEYSPAFGLILARCNDNYATANVHTDNPVVKAASESIESNIHEYLKKEKELTDTRIQCYTDDQRKEYASLQEKALRDKDMLIIAISNCAQMNLEQSLQSAANDIADLSSVIKNDKLKNVNEIPSAGQKFSPFTSSYIEPTPINSVIEPRRRTAFDRHHSVPASAFIDGNICRTFIVVLDFIPCL